MLAWLKPPGITQDCTGCLLSSEPAHSHAGHMALALLVVCSKQLLTPDVYRYQHCPTSRAVSSAPAPPQVHFYVHNSMHQCECHCVLATEKG